jgi:tetratricopeptide (TPR) repeat protein
MNTFFLEFRDPLFSIIIFFMMIFVITFLSYWWGRYKKREDYKHLDKFIQQFRAPPAVDELSSLIHEGKMSQKMWLLLAHSYFKSGEYEKSIEIYNEVLKHSDHQNQKELMFLLGKTYYKAGFLERSKQIFLEILSKHPRTIQVLENLLLVFESMKDYKAALEVLEPLDELKEDISTEESYLKTLKLLNDIDMPEDQKSLKMVELYKDSNAIDYMFFEYMFRSNPALAWENLDHSRCDKIVDLLWHVPNKNLNESVIKNNSYLKELYTARGDLSLVDKSEVFEFDVLINLKNKANATLSFEYICDNCKQLYPFAFYRCSSCHAIDTIGVELSLSKNYTKDYSEESNSFQ